MIDVVRRAFVASALFAALTACAFAQQPPAVSAPALAPDSNTQPQTTTGDASLDDVRRQLQQQRAEIEQLRSTLAEQTRLLNELLARTSRVEAETTTARAGGATVKAAVYSANDVAATDTLRRADPSAGQTATQNPQTETMETRVGRIEAARRPPSALTSTRLDQFSGDIRFATNHLRPVERRAEQRQPGLLGNPLSSRQRLRLRARLAMRGQISNEFDWGLRFSTGTFPDVISPNQTLTDFYSHKTFALDQAFIGYTPSAVPRPEITGR